LSRNHIFKNENFYFKIYKKEHASFPAATKIALKTQIEQFDYFIFDLSIFNTELVKIEAIEFTMAVNFDNFVLKIAKFESEAPKLLNLG
jgi:hypothetical protein